MKRWVALLGALAVIGTGCTTPLAGASSACRLGPPPAAGQITYVQGGRLLAAGPDGRDRHCLADAVAASMPRWDPRGDRLLLDDTRVLLANAAERTGFSDRDRVVWSPAGTSLLAVTADGRLLKRPATGGPAADITFLDRYDTAIYHPGGRAIVAVGEGDSDQGYGIYLADSTGAIQATLAAAETSHHLGSLAWTDNGDLIFAAQHADRWDLHRLDLATGQLTTLASTVTPNEAITDVVTSPFPGGGIAWRQGDCTTGTAPVTRMMLAGQAVAVPPALADATPIGWLPDATLVLVNPDTPCGDRHPPAPGGDVYTLTRGVTTKVASNAANVSVRVVHPPAPPLPAAIPSDAPI